MSKKASEFERLEDKSVIGRYLRYIIESSEAVAFFHPEENIRVKGLAKRADAVALTVEVELDEASTDLTRLKEAFEKKRADQLRIQFALNEAYFFANSELISIYERRLSLRLLLPIFKLQRRDAVRVKVSDSFPCKLKLGNESYIPTDLSATGLSLTVPADKQPLFKPRDILMAAELTFQNKTVEVDLEVKSVETQKKTNKIKVGIRFLKLANTMEQEIAREAYLYTQKIWSRWI